MNGSLQTWLVRAWHRVLFRWRRDQMYRDLEEELSFHHEQTQGVQQMGNVTLAKEECREMWSFMAFERLLQDLRYAFRMYGRTPVFTGISVLSLALGIGGNAAMFSLVNTLLVRPLPYAQPDRLLRITGIYPRAALPFYQGQSHTMDIAAVSRGSKFNLTGQGQATRVTASIASPNFLSVLGTSVARGRNFVSGEESPGRDSVVILSHSLWRDRFGSDPSVLGRVVRVNDVDRQIVGIMPAGFSYPSAKVQLLIPMRLDPSNFVEYWGTEFMPLLARLRPATTLAAAQREVHNLMDEFRGKFPYPMARDFNQDATAIPLQQDIVGDVRGKLIILLASVALVLFIACANVASLLLSRATTRRRELALRAALGASRLRMIRQLLTESIGLALTGAAIGIVLGTGALSIFKSLLPSSLPGLAQATIDWQIVAAVSALALLTGLASGIAPALSASQVDIAETIKTGSQRSTSGLWTRVRSLILAGEVALTLVLLGQVQSLDDIVSGSIADFRSTMRVFFSFAGAAILLAAVGIYGLMSYWVSQRTYEIGLRVAIGATRRGILSMILAQGMRVALFGVGGGIVAAFLLTRFLAALLYGVAATDLLTFAVVTALVLGVAAVATAFPAWRATRIDPLKSLRAE